MAKSFLHGALPRQVALGELYETPKNFIGQPDTPLGLTAPTQGLQSSYFQNFANAAAGLGGLVRKPQQSPYGLSPGASQALDFLKQQTGKDISLYPSQRQDESLAGYFEPKGATGSLFNPPGDTSRSVYLNPNAGYQTLFHEVGHATDPDLRQTNAVLSQFNPQQLGQIPNPSGQLDYLYRTQIQPKVKAETEAQAYSGFQLPRFASSHPGLGINYQQSFDNPWFKEYPASYVEQGIQNFYRGAPTQSVDTPVDESSGVATRVFQPDNARRALYLALDPNFQAKQQQILDETRKYVDTRLDPYQSSPTPWSKDYLGAN